MKKVLAVLAFVAVFSQPLIGIPIGIILGTHAALYCVDTTPSPTCIIEQVNLEIAKWLPTT